MAQVKAKRVTAARIALLFTEAERKAMQQAAYAAWDSVAYDVLAALAEEGKSTVSRAEAIELALDAGRFEYELRDDMRRSQRAGLETPITDDLLKRIASVDYEMRIAVVKPAFTFARYGM